jgi:hypothetical protein
MDGACLMDQVLEGGDRGTMVMGMMAIFMKEIPKVTEEVPEVMEEISVMVMEVPEFAVVLEFMEE